MSFFWDALVQAVRLMIARDSGLLEIVALSLRITGIALLLSTVVGVPIGAWLALHPFRGRQLVVALLYTGMGMPPVVAGLFVYMLLSRSGPLGWLGWLFTPKAMIMAQTLISFPLVAGFTMASVWGVDPDLRRQVRSLGATDRQATLTILGEARLGVITSLVAGFGSIISEVGAVMLVGGNIEGQTRVLTTAVLLETRKGNFDLAMALGIILLLLSFVANLLMLYLQGGEMRRVRG